MRTMIAEQLIFRAKGEVASLDQPKLTNRSLGTEPPAARVSGELVVCQPRCHAVRDILKEGVLVGQLGDVGVDVDGDELFPPIAVRQKLQYNFLLGITSSAPAWGESSNGAQAIQRSIVAQMASQWWPLDSLPAI